MTSESSMPFKSALIIVNPKSGQGESGVEQFAQYLKDAQVRVEIRETTADGTPDDYVRDLENFDALVGAGGDGTVSSLAYAARSFNKPYLPYPAGTANLIAQNLDLPKDPRELADLFLSGRTVVLDLAELEVDGKVHGFAMLAGLGLDAAMIRDSEHTKDRLGVAAYVASALKQLRPQHAHFKLTLDGKDHQVEGMGVMVANFGMANYRVPITGDVSPADGKLTVIVLKGSNITSLLPTLLGSLRAKLHLGNADLGDSLETFDAAEVSVQASQALPAQYDGETLEGDVEVLKARVLPGAVRYFTPAALKDLTT
ncbi:diacylglycerol kinase family lipid kinase [Deinococcus psychrotolerans]|uniref:Diacylglycerol kinase family lipid kinase n=1 Tax=Deinococcus psychrotolerans TaxID=2489213 RepID=A0A3G8YFS6_9DEIO|nr:diacylglycerol kinase family protein [Deinococcus psychrotolerans]AZI44148.1 diacylglycerol kinase family lipid kinase [Deinococcus psychrotolerans]